MTGSRQAKGVWQRIEERPEVEGPEKNGETNGVRWCFLFLVFWGTPYTWTYAMLFV